MTGSCPMPPYSSIKRSTKPIRPKKHAQVRVGKLGIVRLSGKAMRQLREDVYVRDKGMCQCGCGRVAYFQARFEGDPHAYDMAHIVSRGAGGSDVMSNLKTMRHMCHMNEHAKGKLNV